MNGYFIGAGAVSLLTCGVHVFLGGPGVARPLLAAEMDAVAKYTNYLCWHIVSLVLVAMTIGFALAAWQPGTGAQALLWTGLAGTLVVWNLVLVAWKRLRLFDYPQWTLFTPITVLGILGLVL